MELCNEKFFERQKDVRLCFGHFVKTKNDKVVNYEELTDNWESNNSEIITLINNSVVWSIDKKLATYDTAKFGSICLDCTCSLILQNNISQSYICALQQKSMSIEEFYSSIIDLADKINWHS